MFNGKSLLITGGTGSFGKKLAKTVLEKYKPTRLIIFSRDELKQYEMAQKFPTEKYPSIRYFIGDVRDAERLDEALRGVDFIVHAAALKQVPAAEYNPFEAIKTNVLGAQNVIRAAIRQNVKRVIALSTDKAANPVNLYGASKLCSDKLFIAANTMSGEKGARFAAVRYGNVVGSRGSVMPFFLRKRKDGVIPVTDTRMTRFSITLQQGVDFVMDCMSRMYGGEIFVPRIPSYKITDVAEAIAPGCRLDVVGIRPGEKLHEIMVPEDEARNTMEFKDFFVIYPHEHYWREGLPEEYRAARKCPEGFSYSSGSNNEWLSVGQIRKLVEECAPDME